MRKKIASGLTAGAAAVATTVVAMIWPTISPDVGIPLLIGCGVAFVVAGLLWFWPEKAVSSTPLQSTTGVGAHNIHTRDGAVTINNYSPPEKQSAPQPESPWNDPKFSLLGGQRSVSPDIPLSAVLSRLHDVFGGADDTEEGAIEAVERKIHEAIVNAAYYGKIDVWGCMKERGPAKLVWKDAWESGDLSIQKDEITYRSPDNPSGLFRWKGLMFNREQVDHCWPERPKYEMIVV